MVYLVETPKPNIDVSRAEEFGEVTFVFKPNDRRCSVFHTPEFGNAVVQRLEAAGYDPARDYFCVAGSMVSVITALVAIVSHWGAVRVLVYSAPNSKYVERTFDSSMWRGSNEERTAKALPEGSNLP